MSSLAGETGSGPDIVMTVERLASVLLSDASQETGDCNRLGQFLGEILKDSRLVVSLIRRAQRDFKRLALKKILSLSSPARYCKSNVPTVFQEFIVTAERRYLILLSTFFVSEFTTNTKYYVQSSDLT